MKMKVLKKFKDKKEKVIRLPDNEFECTKERAEEIMTILPGYVEEIEPEENKNTEDKDTEDKPEEVKTTKKKG